MSRNAKMSMLLVAMIVANLSLWVSNSLARRNSAFDELAQITDVRYELVNGYVIEPDQTEMVKAAINGMVSSLNDPYSVYLDPDDLKQFDKQVMGTFSGIGAEVMIDPD
ncbi:MAG: hypothetical protein IT440_10465, partial [Phycisphaeraceae bacterium]|nr:hypothetical protein [Phycisphaeraceae bacterium]